MQPPPRRAKLLAAVRATQNQQLCQLQAKHQYDTELLEDLRSFTNKRAQIEKDYSQALLKLATSYLQKKVPNIPEAKIPNKKTIYSIWRTTLDETEKLAKAHLASAEVFQQQISESAKNIKHNKIQTAKKCFDSIRKMHDEIHQDYVEMEKVKKVYFEEEHLAHCARDKAYVAEEKLKRKKGKIFQSLSSLQKNSSKFSYKREACDTRATSSRNQYLLWIYALNTHLSRYHDTEIPALMKVIDGPFYEKIAEYLTIFCRTELLTCSATQNSYANIQSLADTISRQSDLETFLSMHPLVAQKQEYVFEACDEDKVTTLSMEYNASHFLNNECKKWALCYIKDCRVIKQKTKLLNDFLNNSSEKASKSSMSDSGNSDKQVDTELKIDEIKDLIRRSETSKDKAWARLEAMKAAGVNVTEHLQYSDTDSTESQDTSIDERIRLPSQSDTNRNDSQSEEAEIPSEVEATCGSDTHDSVSDVNQLKMDSPECWENGDGNVEITSSGTDKIDSIPQSVSMVPSRPESIVFPVVKGVVLFPYEAVNQDELTIESQEVVEIIGEGDGDGWVKARNCDGVEGYIPQSYIEIENGGEVARSIQPAPVSFSSVDYQIHTGGIDIQGETLNLKLEPPTEISGERFCRSLYDYEATCDEELTFFEGQVIKIINTTVNDVDDGWWEGEIDGKVGLFPSLVVETLKISGEPHTPLDFDNMTPVVAPPAYTPPKPQLFLAPAQVIITQATPVCDTATISGSDENQEESFSSVKENFDMQLNETQHDQYKSQFSSSDSDEHSNVNQDCSIESNAKYQHLVSSPESPIQDEKTEKVQEIDVKQERDENNTTENSACNEVDQSLNANSDIKSDEQEKDAEVCKSVVVITVDTVETPPRSDDENDDNLEDNDQGANSNNESNTGNVENSPEILDEAEIEVNSDEKTESEDAITTEKPSLCDDDGKEQNSPSSESTKSGDSIVEVSLHNENNDSVEAMDQEEDEDESSLR